MILSAKSFSYNGIDLSSFDGVRIGTENSDMYPVTVLGSRVLREEKIPGRPAPYFYGVDDSPLTINVTLALSQAKKVSELRPLFRWLYNNDGYKELIFDTDLNKIYYAIFIGQPEFIYIDQSSAVDVTAQDRKLIGYINLTARCNGPTAFSTAIEIAKINPLYSTPFSLVNNGDNIVFPSLKIQVASTDITAPDTFLIVKIENLSNNTAIEFLRVYPNEEITVDMSIRRISSLFGTVSHNIYES